MLVPAVIVLLSCVPLAATDKTEFVSARGQINPNASSTGLSRYHWFATNGAFPVEETALNGKLPILLLKMMQTMRNISAPSFASSASNQTLLSGVSNRPSLIIKLSRIFCKLNALCKQLPFVSVMLRLFSDKESAIREERLKPFVVVLQTGQPSFVCLKKKYRVKNRCPDSGWTCFNASSNSLILQMPKNALNYWIIPRLLPFCIIPPLGDLAQMPFQFAVLFPQLLQCTHQSALFPIGMAKFCLQFANSDMNDWIFQ